MYTNSYDAGLNARNGFPVFTTLIEANHVEKNEDHFSVHRLTDEDKLEIHRLARDPRIGERTFPTNGGGGVFKYGWQAS